MNNIEQKQTEFIDTKEFTEQAIAENPELKTTTEVSPEVVSEPKKIEDVVKKEEKVSSLLEKIKGMFRHEDADTIFSKNPAKKATYEKYLATDPSRAESYKKAVEKFSIPVWDEVSKTYSSDAMKPKDDGVTKWN